MLGTHLAKMLFRNLKKFTTIIGEYFKGFYFDQDTILESESLSQCIKIQATQPLQQLRLFSWIKINLHYLFPLLVQLYMELDNFYIIVIKYGGHYEADAMPELITHRILEKDFWDICDVLINCGIAQATLIYATLALCPSLDSRGFMFAICNGATKERRRIFSNGKYWTKHNSDQILLLRSKMRQTYTYVMTSAYCQGLAHYGIIHLLNGNNLDCRNLFLHLYLPFFTFFQVYC